MHVLRAFSVAHVDQGARTTAQPQAASSRMAEGRSHVAEGDMHFFGISDHRYTHSYCYQMPASRWCW